MCQCEYVVFVIVLLNFHCVLCMITDSVVSTGRVLFGVCKPVINCVSLQDLSSSSDSSLCDDPTGSSDIRMEGYLFKRTSNTFKTWVRSVASLRCSLVAFCIMSLS